MADSMYDDDTALPIDNRPPRPEPPQPPPDTLQPLPNANLEVTTCRICGRAVLVAHIDANGDCSICAKGGQ